MDYIPNTPLIGDLEKEKLIELLKLDGFIRGSTVSNLKITFQN